MTMRLLADVSLLLEIIEAPRMSKIPQSTQQENLDRRRLDSRTGTCSIRPCLEEIAILHFLQVLLERRIAQPKSVSKLPLKFWIFNLRVFNVRPIPFSVLWPKLFYLPISWISVDSILEWLEFPLLSSCTCLCLPSRLC